MLDQMTDVLVEENVAPVAHVSMVFLGPVAPHWEMRQHYGDNKLLDEFWTRVSARLMLLPKHDPQFRRNRDRVNRDAEREGIIVSWDLGEDDEETTQAGPFEAPKVEVSHEEPKEAEAKTEVESSDDSGDEPESD